MKKFSLSLFSCVVVLLAAMTSCKGGPSNAEVGNIVNQYNPGVTLSQDDYGKLLDYMNSAFGSVMPIYKEFITARINYETEKEQALEEELEEKLYGKYPLYDDVYSILDGANLYEFDSSNMKKLEAFRDKMVKVTGHEIDIYDVF